MATVRKKISELTPLTSASLDTTIVGVDNGTTYKIELDTLADAVTLRVNILDRDRLSSLESVTSSFETKGRTILSGSVSYTSLTNIPQGIVSQSTDLSSLNTFTASISTASLVTSISNLNSATSSYLTSLNGTISSSSQLTSSYDTRYTLSGSVQPLPSNLVSSSAQITELGFISSSAAIPVGTISGSSQLSGTTIQNLSGSFTGSFRGNLAGTAAYSDLVKSLNANNNQDYSLLFVPSGSNGYLQTYTDGLSNIVYNPSTNRLKSSYLQGEIEATNGVISGSSQLTSSFDSRYVLESETGSLQTSITNLNSFTQSFSTSVDSRLDTLEASIISGSPNYTQVLGNRRTSITTTGVSIISGSITTTGNPVQIMVTGDANPVNVTSWTRLQIYRDENAIGGIVQVENSSNLNVPYCVNVIDTPPAGTYSYSMRTVGGISGLFDFGESTGPVLTAVELNTNTNLPSTNNTFTGTNRFNGQVTLGAVGGDEGGELRLVTAQTNTTLTGSYVTADIYQNRLRFYEGGGDFRGVYIDLSKTPAGNAGELLWKSSGMVAVGTFVTLDNLKCTVTSAAQGNRGLSIGAVSTTFEADVSGWYTVAGGSGGATGNNITYTTTASNSAFNWNFPTHGDMVNVNLRDKTNNRFYRITMMMGASYISNFISIERLF